MKHVRFRLGAPGREADIHPTYALLADRSVVERATAIQWSFVGDEFGVMLRVEGEADAFAEGLEEIPQVRAYELERADEGSFYAYIRDTTTPEMRSLFRSVARSPTVVVPPVRYAPGGTVSFSVFGPESEIQAALEDAPAFVDIDVREVSTISAVPGVYGTGVTDRQREALEAGLSLGYYAVPREASHEDVAEAIGCAPSTAAEHLRKGEAKLLRSILEPSRNPKP